METEKRGVFNTLATPTARREQALAGMVRTDVEEGVVAEKEPGNQHRAHRGLRPTLASIFRRASIESEFPFGRKFNQHWLINIDAVYGSGGQTRVGMTRPEP